MSTYTTGFPNPNQSLGNSRPKVFDNWQIIKDRFAVNHIGFNDGATAGKHKYLQMPTQGSTPGTAADEIALMAGFNPPVFLVQRPGGLPGGTFYHLTANITPLSTTNGYSFLPGSPFPSIIQWGIVSPPGTFGTVLFATANMNFPNNVFQVHLTLLKNTVNETAVVDQATPPTTTEFSYLTTASGASTSLYWFAIGN